MYCDFSHCPNFQKRRPGHAAPVPVHPAKPSASLTRWGSGESQDLLFFAGYLERVCSHPCGFAFRQVKNARAAMGPEYIAKVTLKAMAETGIETAEWKAHSLRGAAATHFMAKGVPGAVVQAWSGWASAATMATYYARHHQLIPWVELSSSLSFCIGIWARCSALPVLCQGQFPFKFFNFGGGGNSGSLLDGANCA